MIFQEGHLKLFFLIIPILIGVYEDCLSHALNYIPYVSEILRNLFFNL